MSRSLLARFGGGAFVALLAVAALLLLSTGDAAKTHQQRVAIQLPKGHHPTFPTHDELHAHKHLRERYAGDNKVTGLTYTCMRTGDGGQTDA